jgi:hypothetical protein
MGASNIISLGRCTATWNSQALGYVQDVKATLEHKTNLVMVEAFAAPVDAIEGGWAVSVELTVLERDYAVLDALDNVVKVIGTATTGTKVAFGSAAGAAATQGILTLVSTVSTRTPVHDMTIAKAVLSNCSPTVVWKPDESCQQGFVLTFTGIIDTTSLDVAVLGVNAASVA